MKTLLLGLLLGTAATAATAVNFSGKWAMQLPLRFGPIQHTMTLTLVLNQVGNEVTGTLTSASPFPSATGSPMGTEILDGKVEGDTLSFYVWTGQDQPVKRYYKGTMSGEEITFTVTGGAPGPGFGEPAQSAPQKVVAKRSH